MGFLQDTNEKRLRHLLSSWTLRALPGAPVPADKLINENIEALGEALGASKVADMLADNFTQALEILEPLQRRLISDARKGKPYDRDDLRGLADTVGEVMRSLKDKL